MGKKDTLQPENGAILADNAEGFPLNPTIRIISVDENGLREILLKLRNSEKWIADLAPKLGVTPQQLGNVLAGKRGFGPKLLRGMGVIREYRMFDVEIIVDGIEDAADE